uniref:Superantigen n=1 Tax=Metamycoplasma arthritidis TaxID=2111 RepID=UPI0001D1F7DB|nr:Chain A, Superantigen [Metamycoplasma arthritidis]3KPH_B Chain B, Superantigen [Metamycoplasma arthritidis]
GPLGSMKLRVENPKKAQKHFVQNLNNVVFTNKELEDIYNLSNKEETKEVLKLFKLKVNQFYRHAFGIVNDYNGLLEYKEIFNMMFLKLSVVFDTQRKEANNVEQIKRNIAILDEIMAKADNDLSYFISQNKNFQELWDKAVKLTKEMKIKLKGQKLDLRDGEVAINKVRELFGSDKNVKELWWFRSLLVKGVYLIKRYYEGDIELATTSDFAKAVFE